MKLLFSSLAFPLLACLSVHLRCTTGKSYLSYKKEGDINVLVFFEFFEKILQEDISARANFNFVYTIFYN